MKLEGKSLKPDFFLNFLLVSKRGFIALVCSGCLITLKDLLHFPTMPRGLLPLSLSIIIITH